MDAVDSDDISAVWVVAPSQINSTITMVDYCDDWGRQYQHEAARIRRTLSSRLKFIEHIGSTAVPYLCAKPIIDILVAVSNSATERTYVPALVEAGYQLVIRELTRDQHRMFRVLYSSANIHVFPMDSSEILHYLTFRNWLRSNELDRELYARTKRRLARRRWKYVHHYTAAKTDVILQIMARAREAV